MKKFVQEVVTYFWIPLIMALVSYIFFQLRDFLLGIITLVSLSAIYTIVRLYFAYKKWWLLIIGVVVVVGSIGFFFARAPASTLTINGQLATGATVSLSNGSVTVSPPVGSTDKYTSSTVVMLTANPAAGFNWKSWEGTDNDTSNPTTVTMHTNKNVKVNFEQRYSLVINNQLVIGSFVSFNEGSVSVNPPPEGDGKYTNGTKVTLTASANPGFDWKGWLGTGTDKSNPTTVTMSDSNKQITVDFGQRFTLTISNQLVISSSVSFDQGTVSINPAPADDGKYANGTKITLTATPYPGYGWKSWSGTTGDASNPAIVTISGDKHVAVTFEPRFILTINNQPVTDSPMNFTGGSVSLNPAPGTDGRYANNASAMLSAVAASGYRFDHWSGDASGTAITATTTMNANKSVTAVFIKLYLVTTSVSPAEGGTISPISGPYDEGASLTFRAVPAAGYRFNYWSGDASGTSTPTTVIMNTDKNITANFIKVFTVTSSVSPANGGTVSPSSGTYDEGASVVITAVPSTGYGFDHWSGDASGTDVSVTVNMTSNKTVTANFIKVYTLTVSVSPAGGGSISPSIGTFNEGTNVTITAVPATGYSFGNWSGDASGTSASVSVNMTANKSVTANFIKTGP